MRSRFTVVLCSGALTLLFYGCPPKGDSVPVGPSTPTETALNHTVGTRLVFTITRSTNNEPDEIENVSMTVMSRTEQNGVVALRTNDGRDELDWVLSNGRLSMVSADTAFTQVIGPWPTTKNQTFRITRDIPSPDGTEFRATTFVYTVLNADTLVTTKAGQFRCAHVEVTQLDQPLGTWSVTRYLYNGSTGLVQLYTESLASIGAFEFATKQRLVLDNILR